MTSNIDDISLMKKLNSFDIYYFLKSKGKLYHFKEFLVKLISIIEKENNDSSSDQEHLKALKCLVNCYQDMGQIENAISILEEVSVKESKILGPYHPRTLLSLDRLTRLHREIGQIEKSLSSQEDVLSKRSKVLGQSHPDTLSSLGRLASCYQEIGQVEKAISIYEDVSDRETSKGAGPKPSIYIIIVKPFSRLLS